MLVLNKISLRNLGPKLAHSTGSETVILNFNLRKILRYRGEIYFLLPVDRDLSLEVSILRLKRLW